MAVVVLVLQSQYTWSDNGEHAMMEVDLQSPTWACLSGEGIRKMIFGSLSVVRSGKVWYSS